MSIGDKIKERRIQLGWSQQKLADLMGYTSKSTITKIEKGKSDVNQKNIERFAEVLKVSIAYLMDWEEDEEPAEADSFTLKMMEIAQNATPEQKAMILGLADTVLRVK